MSLAMCLLGSVGMTLIVTLSVLAWRLRLYGCRCMRRLGLRLSCPLYCPMCAGFWIGAVTGSFHSFFFSNLSSPLLLGYAGTMMGCSTSAVSFLAWIWLLGRGVTTQPGHDAHRWRLEIRSRK